MTELETLQSYRTTNPLSRAEEREAFAKLRAGDTSQTDRITRANLRFVISVAQRYVRPDVGFGDLVSSGSVGLLRAIKDFDHTQGFKFITFAVWWIRQQILLDLPQLKQRNPVRIPTNVYHLQEQVYHARTALEQDLLRPPNHDEIFVRIESTSGKPVTPGMRERVLQTLREPLSLDHPVYDTEDYTHQDRLAIDENIHQSVEEGELRLQIEALIDTLSDRERLIIRAYFGFGGQNCRSLEAIGVEHGITRERVRQILEVAKGKLRQQASLSALAEKAP